MSGIMIFLWYASIPNLIFKFQKMRKKCWHIWILYGCLNIYPCHWIEPKISLVNSECRIFTWKNNGSAIKRYQYMLGIHPFMFWYSQKLWMDRQTDGCPNRHTDRWTDRLSNYYRAPTSSDAGALINEQCHLLDCCYSYNWPTVDP
jgi:hypothetical protein